MDAEELVKESELLGPGLIHEMRHPLMGIKAGLELLARRTEVSAVEEFRLVVQQVARLEELFRTYQDLFAPQRPSPSAFIVEPVVQRGIDLLSHRLRRLGARFTYQPRGTTYGYGAAHAVLHAVTNLLVNAADAVEGGGRIEARVVDGEGGAEVRVSDDGEGIAPEDVARLFTARFTTKPEGKGTGLGLHLARAVMERSGGGLALVPAEDPQRLPWARTEFAVRIARVP